MTLSLEMPQPTQANPLAPVGRGVALDRPLVTLDRSDIVFFNVAPERVRIQVTFHNRGDRPSAPTQAAVSAAPFGAFVRWQPLLTLAVPALPRRSSVTLTAEAVRPLQPTRGVPVRVRPGRILVATDTDEPRRAWSVLGALRQAFGLGGIRGTTVVGAGPWFPAVPNELHDRQGWHWAGNLNVFVGGRAVERHMARQLRVVPGRTNCAAFFVGDGPDAYAFDLGGDADDWPVALLANLGQPIEFGNWVEFSRRTALQLLIKPPQACTAGTLEVHVRQRSTGQEAVVEFGFDPEAVGPGCYTL